MKMVGMSLEELTDFGQGLGDVLAAATLLSEAGLDPVISLTAFGTVLRCPSLLGAAQDDGTVVLPVESDGAPAPVAGLVGSCPAGSAVATEDPAAPPQPVQPAPVASAESDPAPKSGSTNTSQVRNIGSDGLLRGPWLAEEDALARRMNAEGESLAAIARMLNRPVSALRFRAYNVLDLARAGAQKDKNDQVSGPRAKAADPVELASLATDHARDKTQTSGVARVPQSNPATSGPREHPSGAGRLPQSGGVAAPAASGGQPPSASQGGAASQGGPGDLSGLAKELWFEIASLKRDPVFDDDLDFDLVDGLTRGRKLGELALELDIDAAVGKSRFALLTSTLRDANGHLTLDGQRALLSVLKRRMSLNRAGSRDGR